MRSGKSLYGKDGTFAPLLKHFLDAALEAEIETHLDENERFSGNRKNGKTWKDIKTSAFKTCLLSKLGEKLVSVNITLDLFYLFLGQTNLILIKK